MSLICFSTESGEWLTHPLLLFWQITNSMVDLLKKLTVAQLAKKLPDLYGTRRFMSVFTGDSHWKFMIRFHNFTYYFLKFHFNIILRSKLGSLKQSFPVYRNGSKSYLNLCNPFVTSPTVVHKYLTFGTFWKNVCC